MLVSRTNSGKFLYAYIIQDDGTAQIIASTGNDTSLTIPSTLDGIPVTALSDKLFYNRNDIVRITLPDSLTSIGKDAFRKCPALILTVPCNSYARPYSSPDTCDRLTD